MKIVTFQSGPHFVFPPQNHVHHLQHQSIQPRFSALFFSFYVADAFVNAFNLIFICSAPNACECSEYSHNAEGEKMHCNRQTEQNKKKENHMQAKVNHTNSKHKQKCIWFASLKILHKNVNLLFVILVKTRRLL